MGFNGRFVLNIVHFAGRKGVDISHLLETGGWTEAELMKEECKLESEEYNKIIEKAIDLTGDEFFGLHIGESLSLAAAGLIAQITQTSTTVKEALEYCCEFAQLGCSSLPMKLEKLDNRYVLSMVPEKLWAKQSDKSVRHTVEGTLAFTIREYHSLTHHKHFPLKIELPYPAPQDISEYERLLGCPVQFDRDKIAMWFSENQIEAPVVNSDYKLLRILVEHAHNKLETMNNSMGIDHRVRTTIIQLVSSQFPTLEQVASHLNVSVRTLQRRLAEEGTTYKEIVDSLRHDFALSYLEKRDLTINEISYLLSYNDASSFIRSFKKNTGKTPREYRMQRIS